MKKQTEEKLTVEAIKVNCLNKIVVELAGVSDPTLMTIRFFANQTLDRRFSFEMFSKRVTDLLKDPEKLSMTTFKPTPPVPKQHRINIVGLLNTAERDIANKNESPRLR